MTALSSQKLKDTKYSMWLQKDVNNSIQQDFLNRVPLYCVVSLILLFLSHDHFVQPKAEKRKIPFLVTKRGQKFNPIKFSDPQPRNCG